MSISKSDSYAAAGVDVTAGYEAVNRIKPLVESTKIPGVIGGLGGFGGLFAPQTEGMKEPVLVSGTDGVGTKLKIAFLMDKHTTVGIDCVAMCVNDIVCAGASPMFFLDYVACGKNVPQRIEQIVSGIAEGCRQAGCALIGGETAEMPGFYPEDEYDLAGFSVGIVDKEQILDGHDIVPGDILIGLGSNGIHSNGYSLVRKVLDIENADLKTVLPELGCSLGDELLKPCEDKGLETVFPDEPDTIVQPEIQVDGSRRGSRENQPAGAIYKLLAWTPPAAPPPPKRRGPFSHSAC